MTPATRLAWSIASSEAAGLNAAYVDVEHLVLGLLKLEALHDRSAPGTSPEESVAILTEVRGFIGDLKGVPFDCVVARRRLRQLWRACHTVRQTFQGRLTPRGSDVVTRAAESTSPITLVGLWRSSLAEPSSLLDQLFESMGVARDGLVALAPHSAAEGAGEAQLGGLPPGFGRDLTHLAVTGGLHAAVGRDQEMRQIARILSQAKKRNPLLVGDPGVGKTAIVEALADRIARAGPTGPLAGVRIFELSLAGLLSGARFRGDVEQRIRTIVERAEADSSLVLFIDEIHMLLGAGDRVGGLDLANLLKPALARGILRIIGATTHDDYRRYIERDAALERRFQMVRIEEPSAEATLAILDSLRRGLEDHHAVSIEPDALKRAIDLSVRYLPDRRLPDKAIDVIDRACARARLITLSPPQHGPPSRSCLTAEDVAQTVAEMVGVPVGHVIDATATFPALAPVLAARLVGQHEAIQTVSGFLGLRRSEGLQGRRPRAVLLFAGPTGTGKTEMARLLADWYSSGAGRLVQIDMSEYSERHSVARLVGAPPGYVGHEQGGQLTDPIRTNPHSVVLFDEIDKAHPAVFDLFLQIFEEGRLTDARGRRVDFREAIVVMTTNAGFEPGAMVRRIGLNPAPSHRSTALEDSSVAAALSRLLRPELRSRIDREIIFRPLGDDAFVTIAERALEAIGREFASRSIELSWSRAEVEWIAIRAAGEEIGARGVRRAVQLLLEEPLERFLAHDLRSSGLLHVRALDDGLRFVWASKQVNV